MWCTEYRVEVNFIHLCICFSAQCLALHLPRLPDVPLYIKSTFLFSIFQRPSRNMPYGALKINCTMQLLMCQLSVNIFSIHFAIPLIKPYLVSHDASDIFGQLASRHGPFKETKARINVKIQSEMCPKHEITSY